MAAREQAVIVGAGHAGAAAAMELREAGFPGRIVLVGDERHLPYERPPLSKDILVGHEAGAVLLHDQAALDEAGVDLLLGRAVRAIDPASARILCDDGDAVAYDHLLLTPGGTARTLPVRGAEHAVTLRTLDDAHALRSALRPGLTVGIVGAGVIGLEVAASATGIGCRCVVVERQAGPMARSLDPVAQAFLSDLHRSRGVELIFDATLGSIEPRRGGGQVLNLADASLEVDLVVAGVGLAPRLDLARTAGLDIVDGIRVDEFGRTSVAGIHAAGDATSFWHPRLARHVHWQTWQHAQNHGKAVARAMAGAGEPYDPAFWFWTDQHGVNLQIAGFPLDGEETLVRGSLSDAGFALFHLAAGAVVGATLVNRGGLARPTQALIRAGLPVDRDKLADPSIPLPALARRGSA